MDATQALEFEAHLVTCANCQEEVAALLAQKLQPPKAAPAKSGNRRRIVLIVLAASLTLIAGFALGWSIWQMANR
jgi:anti-sigma factor RsiW